MFGTRGAWLGQVRLAGRALSKPGIAEGQEVPANGGYIKKAVGFLWFFPDPDVRAAIERETGKPVSESIEARVTFCNPTPGTVPVLGDFIDPETGLVCFLELPEGWNAAWRRAPRYEDRDEGTPPYWGEWGVVDEETGAFTDCGKVGPFATIDEAFTAAGEAASEHGARKMPLDGFAQVVDSQGKSVGPII